MSKTDVNAEFDTMRAGQIAAYVNAKETQSERMAELEARIASGELTRTGPTTVRVNTGWDRNEVFDLSRTGLLEPQSGLEGITGLEEGWFAQPEWHNLGNVGGLGTLEEVLAKSGLDYTVGQRPVRFFDDEGNLNELDETFVNYITETGKGLAAVGNKYVPFQNRDAFAFLTEVVGKRDAKFASAFPLRGGRRAVISMELPEGIDIELPEGQTDHINLYLAFFNSHDGKGKAEAKVTPWRPRCANTERMAIKGALVSWGTKHTSHAAERAQEARRELGLTLKYADEFKVQEEKLAAVQVTFDDIDKVIAQIWDATDEESAKRAVTLENNRRDAVYEKFTGYRAELGSNAYAAERSLTDYLDHVAPMRARGNMMDEYRATAALVGEQNESSSKKTAAHRELMKLTVR